MSKAAFIILAAGDKPESLGCIVNGLMGALEFTEAGGDVKIIFDGADERRDDARRSGSQISRVVGTRAIEDRRRAATAPARTR